MKDQNRQQLIAPSTLPKPSGWFSVQASIDIDAPLEQVWSVLVDLERYRLWNTFVPSMLSSFQVGSMLTMQVRLRKGIQVKSVETITAIEDQHLLAWITRAPGWLLQGERFQVITSIDAHRTHYWTREAFTGVLAPVLQILLGKDLRRGFEAVARDLKARAELLLREEALPPEHI
jgi:hypothetical protein